VNGTQSEQRPQLGQGLRKVTTIGLRKRFLTPSKKIKCDKEQPGRSDHITRKLRARQNGFPPPGLGEGKRVLGRREITRGSVREKQKRGYGTGLYTAQEISLSLLILLAGAAESSLKPSNAGTLTQIFLYGAQEGRMRPEKQNSGRSPRLTLVSSAPKGKRGEGSRYVLSILLLQQNTKS